MGGRKLRTQNERFKGMGGHETGVMHFYFLSLLSFLFVFLACGFFKLEAERANRGLPNTILKEKKEKEREEKS